MNIIVDTLLISYTLAGKGRLVLLLHGWGDSAKGMAGLQDRLSRQYHVLAVDLPGFGASEPPKTAWDLDNYAEFTQSLLAKLGLPQPYAIIGHSNGGALAIRAIRLGCLRPQKLVLLAASGVRSTNKFKRSALKIVAKTGKVVAAGLPAGQQRALRKRLYGVAGSDMLVAPHLQETFKKTVRQDVQADAGRIDVPSLLIYAADDEAIPVADGKKYHALIHDSRLEILQQAGHFVHLDQPARVGELVEEFLQ